MIACQTFGRVFSRFIAAFTFHFSFFTFHFALARVLLYKLHLFK